MNTEAEHRLETQFATHRIVRQLHDVPPHEVYEIFVEGRHAIYKGDTGSTGSAGVEGRVIAFLGKRTSVPVPEILAVGEEFFVAAWHPDAPVPETGPEAYEAWAYPAGKGLASLHNETAPLFEKYGQLRPQNEEVTVSGSDEWHTAALDYVRRHRPILARYGHADIADLVVEFLEDHPDAFAGAGEPVCCHGWATPEQVAVVAGSVACLVDFEHAIAAPGEFDYWRTALPTFGSDDSYEKTFRDGYESVRSLPNGFACRKPLYILLNTVYYFESLYVQNQHDPEETAKRAEWLRSRVRETIDELT
jgi:fructosamine-3-kinase